MGATSQIAFRLLASRTTFDLLAKGMIGGL
jgi:hypothetical protein